VPEAEVLVTRGSSEAIDILIRGFCTAGQDSIVICPPTFDMYRLYAEIQGARVIRVPLLRSAALDQDFAIDIAGILEQIAAGAKLVFICSPNNPTGTSAATTDLERLCAESAGRAVIVIDEAYLEFSDRISLRVLQERFDHVVVLRTLSKFVSLAGVRCGVVLARQAVIEFLERVLPPYTFPTPSIELVSQTLGQDVLAVSTERIGIIRSERTRLESALTQLPDIEKVWPSDANFVFIQAADAQRLVADAHNAGILVRVFPNDPSLANCVRITVGKPEDNGRLLAALGN
jgi:histidinol-phosphate aminotransferase